MNIQIPTEKELDESDNSPFSRDLTLFYAEEQERIALRIANTLGERYGWDHEEKDAVCMEVLEIMTEGDK